jgi:hypothetical protein
VRQTDHELADTRFGGQLRGLTGQADLAPSSCHPVYFDTTPVRLQFDRSKYLDHGFFGREARRQ